MYYVGGMRSDHGCMMYEVRGRTAMQIAYRIVYIDGDGL